MHGKLGPVFRAYLSRSSCLRPAANPGFFVGPPRRYSPLYRLRRASSPAGFSLGLEATEHLLRQTLSFALVVFLPYLAAAGEPFELWQGGRVAARLIPPRIEGPMRRAVQRSLNGRFEELFGRRLPVVRAASGPGNYILVGDASSNPAIAELAQAGLDLGANDLGEEGFRLFSVEKGDRRFVIVTARTPVGLKHGCLELVFFRTRATSAAASIDWPLDISMRPQFPYRGIYMLPCWSAYDDLDTWKEVLRFNSELTLNRNWFWLAGFPLIDGYAGKYSGSDLAVLENVRELIGLSHEEGMRFYIGGGWYNWHHADAAAGSIERGIQYYRDLLRALPAADGLYIEPTGEGSSVDEATARKHMAALRELLGGLFAERPDFEVAVAVGKFNSKAWREALAAIEPKRLYWWWCWGDPIRDGALAEYPLVLRWHTVIRMSEYHGSVDPPSPGELALAGFATSYDPGQGYGNPWNGWGALGVESPRDVHPYTMPYFSHQYRFRERCWNVNLSDEEFEERLSRRLFDADMPAGSIRLYLRLAELCPKPEEARAEEIEETERFVRAHAILGTPRNRDTLARMREALDGIRRVRARSAAR